MLIGSKGEGIRAEAMLRAFASGQKAFDLGIKGGMEYEKRDAMGSLRDHEERGPL
jgi:hypothetical protein